MKVQCMKHFIYHFKNLYRRLQMQISYALLYFLNVFSIKKTCNVDLKCQSQSDMLFLVFLKYLSELNL